MGSFPKKKLEQEVKDAGNKLFSPPSSIDELLSLLDQVEILLTKVEQGPSKSMQNALLPSTKALIANELLRHPNVDVKVSSVSCITEVLRIAAPCQPYSDDQMKEIFQLTVMALEKLSNVFGRCYTKALSILESVATVRSCVVMLYLKCDELIVEMFQHFLSSIRSNHPHAVFLHMVTIMTLLVDESEEISMELLRPLLTSLKKENQNVSPLSWKMAEKVMNNCSAKLKPYLREAVGSMGIAFNDYAEVVASICQDASEGEALRNVSLSVTEPLPKDKDASHLGKASRTTRKRKDPKHLDKAFRTTRKRKDPKHLDIAFRTTRKRKDASHLDKASRIKRKGKHTPRKEKISGNEREEKLQTGTLPTGPTSTPSIRERSNTCSDMIDVHGYKVKASTVPTLEAIFAKHGDIALNCLYKSASVRSFLLEVVCDVVHRLQSNDLAKVLSEFKVIENEVADAEAAKLEVSWLREHLEKIRKVERAGQSSSMLKNAKVYSVLVTKAATKELGERNVELLEAQERVKDAEKRVNVLKLVSRKISDEILESEADEYFWRRRLDGVI